MSFVNLHTAPPTEDLSTNYGPNPYDINFVFPLHLLSLETERIKLVPFIPRLYAQLYLDQVLAHPELLKYLPAHHRTLADVLSFFEGRVRRDPAWSAFAIIDKVRPDAAHPELGGSFTGMLSLHNTNAANLSAEIGWIVVFPAFQRTHVTSNAVGALLRYCLELPTAPARGLGLRRVQWAAHPENAPSLGAGQRMGFRREGTLRWMWVLPEGKYGNGIAPREGDPKGSVGGRDSAMLSFCADDWESGGRERVQEIIDRRN
ncbi:acyl-CoA N-acyltransferase [Amylostereum chailletii]|nr:acyl-CoA N-acyltransferase [Amylostereum chailletii]